MKTAVETLFERIEEIEFIDPAAARFYEEVISLKEQAKAMEKEQICNAYVYGAAYGIDVLNNLIPDTYYNETFKSE